MILKMNKKRYKKNKNKDIIVCQTVYNFDPSDTYIDKFNKMVDKNNVYDSAIKALGVLNSEVLAKKQFGEVSESEIDDIINFAEYFMDEYYDENMEEMIFDNWCDYPRILREADYYIAEREEKYLKSLTSNQRSAIDTLADYILNLKSDIWITTLAMSNTEVIQWHINSYNKDEYTKESILSIIVKLHKSNGVLTIREEKSVNEHMVCSFTFKDGNIETVSDGNGKKTMSTLSDGRVVKETFVTAPLILPK